jgi:hypothetical protein
MRIGGGIKQVINRNDLDFPSMSLLNGFQNLPANSAETIDTNSYYHFIPP